MRTTAHETRAGRTTSLLLLFIRTADDLVYACRQMEEFLAFCRSRQSGSFADGRLLGAWIDEQAVIELPQELTLRLHTNKVITLAVRETFSLWGVWSVASIEPPCPETNEHGKCAAPDDETCHAHFPLSNFPPKGERANESLREFHVNADMGLSHDLVLDALLALARGDTARVGRYSPAFARDTPEKQVCTEIERLNTRYPLRIERPIYYDPVTGGLFLDEEWSRTIRMERQWD
ncbi:MAG: hypothetical protein EPO42_10985 [Gallionellaceae bacterium]|nr:MAG: hypothetical protein EPO42_10985 [Gallionellaceae bacterium]